jgi:hypothetical protein
VHQSIAIGAIIVRDLLAGITIASPLADVAGQTFVLA